MEKLSFNKRISRVKMETFRKVTESGELSNIKGSDKTGFYSLAIIEKHLFPFLDKYDLDLDLEIYSDKIIGVWIDCQGDSEKTRKIEIDFSRIIEVDRLPMMANVVQSEGGVKSYTRRYALTSILRLPSTDLIDTNILDDNNKTPKTNNKSQNNNRTQNKSQNNKVTEKQLKRLYAISNKNKKDDVWVKKSINYFFNLNDKKELNNIQYDYIIDIIESKENSKKITSDQLDNLARITTNLNISSTKIIEKVKKSFNCETKDLNADQYNKIIIGFVENEIKKENVPKPQPKKPEPPKEAEKEKK